MRTNAARNFLLLLALLLVNNHFSYGFLCRPPSSHVLQSPGVVPSLVDYQRFQPSEPDLPAGVSRQRRSVGRVQTMGLFGLGFAEIGVILVVLGFVLGPETLGRLARGSASMAKEYQQELSKVPEEFQKGLEEGEADARARKAKPMQMDRKKNGEN